jgi:PD-(D/E)XK endonuclease
MRSTQRKGDRATAQAIAAFTALGYDVAIPLTESAAYDLVVDDGEGLRRVQCKFASGREVDLRRIHSNSQGYVVKRVLPRAYDWLYVLRADGHEFLLKRCHDGRRSVTPSRAERLIVPPSAPASIALT